MEIEIINKLEDFDTLLIVGNDLETISKWVELGTYESYVQNKIDQKCNTILTLPFENKTFFIALLLEEQKTKARQLEFARRLASQAYLSIEAEKHRQIPVLGEINKDLFLAFMEGMLLSSYQFEKYKTNQNKDTLETILIDDIYIHEIENLKNICDATSIARTLVNEPVSYLTAPQLSKEIKSLSKKCGFDVKILEKKQIESLKMGGLLAVNKGSEVPPTFNILEWKPADAKNSKPIVLVGKGVVYDTGGYDLKTDGHMTNMKMDMGGAAAVIGAICATSKNKIPLHVIGLIPSTDNRIGPNGLVADDVIKMFDGTTVEVKNTDAEGRLILADALAYAKKYEPELVIDLATLTGAAMRVTSHYGSAMMGNAEKKVKEQLINSGETVHERLIEFPFWEEFEEEIKSDIADIKNLGNPSGGATTAGKFLEHFTDYPWIHLDIAGPAFVQKPYHYLTTGGTGVGVRLLYHFFSTY